MILLPAMVQAAEKNNANRLEETARTLFLRPIIDTLGAVYRFFSPPQNHGTLVVEGLPPGWTFEIMGVAKDESSQFAPQTENFVLLPPGEYTLAIKGPLKETLEEATVKVETNKVTPLTYRVERGEEGLSRNGWGYVMIGGGVLLAGGGGLLGWLSHEQVKEVDSLSRGPDKGAWEEGVGQGQALQLGANLSFGAATLLVSGGICLLLTDGDPTPSKGESGVQITPGGAGVTITW